jgi:carbon-monoxide dehydrogenase medium subunit
MSIWSNYIVADSLSEALAALSSNSENTRPVAGGTDLLIEIQQGRTAPVDTLVDVSSIPELKKLEIRNDHLFVGGAVSVREITESPLVREHAAAVSEAAGLIGGPQVRNTATLGGNVAHALPAADGMVALVALGATVEIAGADGVSVVPILELFLGPGKSTLQRDHRVLVGFRIPLRKAGQGSAFSRIMRPQGVALPILNAAAWIEREGDIVHEARIAVGPSGPVPTRAATIEDVLRGEQVDSDLLGRIAEAIPVAFRFRSSAMRAGSAYRFDMCKVLLEEVIMTAWQRAEMVAKV